MSQRSCLRELFECEVFLIVHVLALVDFAILATSQCLKVYVARDDWDRKLRRSESADQAIIRATPEALRVDTALHDRVQCRPRAYLMRVQ